MCRRAAIELPPEPLSAHRARHFLAETCRRWELDDLRDDLLLAVSELVTNSVIHARTPIAVRAAVTSGHVEIGVLDHDLQAPIVRAGRDDLLRDLDEISERLPSFQDSDPRHPSTWVGDAGSVAAGRGLHLLSAVSEAWGVATTHGTRPAKEVWFTNAIPASWPYHQDCVCGPASSDRTASGLAVTKMPGPWDLGEPEPSQKNL
jgi:hypothetical protein